MDFEIEVADETAPDYDIAPNFAENLVDAVRADHVGNEEVYLLTHFVYATGLFPDPDHYDAQIITGSSGDGKSGVKKLVDRRWPDNWLLQMTDASEKGPIDDERFNERYIFAGDELNKLHSKTREILKSSFGDDADDRGWGYVYVRNTSAEEEGDDHEEKKKQTLPFTVLMADENKSGARDWELDTRMLETKVTSDRETNEAVSATMWDHDHVSTPDREYEYEYNFEQGKAAIDAHIAGIPLHRYDDPPEGWAANQRYAYPVAIPHDDERDWPLDGGNATCQWDAHAVAKSMLPMSKSDSKRSSKLVANLVRASALLNYHNRETTDVNGYTHYIAEPQDLGNVIACRETLLATTHDLDDKRLAIIEALIDEHNGVGGTGPNGGLQATVQDIAHYIDEYASVSAVTEDQLRPMLEDMANRFLLTIHEGEGPNGAHMYEYHGGSAFGHPNVDMYPDAFADVTDPIRDQHITETVRQHQELLSDTTFETSDMLSEDFETDAGAGARSGTSEGAESESEGTLDAFDPDAGSTDPEWDEVDQRVHERLQETLDDMRVHADAMREGTDNHLTVQHMLGVSPVDVYTDGGFRFVRAERPRRDGDRENTIYDPSDPLWGDVSEGQIEQRIERSVEKLREHDVFEPHEESVEHGDAYLVVHDFD